MANFTTFFSHTNPQTPSSLHSLKPFSYLLNYSPFHLPKSCIIPLSRFKRKPFNLSCSTSHLNDCSNVTSNQISGTGIWADCSYIEVIGIGSRVDSVLDFCLQSSSCPQSLRFWNVIRSESSRGQLRQRLLRQDSSNIVEAPLSNSRSHSKAVVLVASAGYGDDYVLATEILRSISSGSGMVAAIILKPFSFEGQRRQHEVDLLVDRLQDCVNFFVDIDIDTLLKMDLVTLDEALKNAYRAVSSAITAVSVLVSDSNRKYIHSLNGSMRQVSAAEIKNVLASYKEGRVGFGVGHNVEASIVQAVYDCPFLSVGLKDLDGVVVCILSSSSAMEDSDMHTLLCAFREVTECINEVILSVNHNHDMKPNLIASTVITVGHAEGKSLQKSSILSRLADSIPFVFNFLRGNKVMSDNSLESDLREKKIPSMSKYLDKNEVPEPDKDATENSEMFADKDMLLKEDYDEKASSNGGTERNGRLDAAGNFVEPNSRGAQASGAKPLINRNAGPGYRMVQERQEDQLNYSEAASVADNPRAFQLPVGVRLSDDVHSTVDRTIPRRLAIRFADGDATVSASAVPSVSSSNGLTDMGFEAVTDIWNNASTLLKGKDLDVPKKQGLLSARAASMLEVERDSKSRWSPVMKIEYRGGIYKGHCQGGLPEGRGRLTFQDGSVYDGMWRYGKRSGLGSLVFSNGDVFHGSWRDDLMHGKGWLYFHTGERWFANFWKGIPNGEGRFYSKSGEVFFGHFQDGWRDGRFLCVKVDGRRYVEIWNNGVLVSCEELDS